MSTVDLIELAKTMTVKEGAPVAVEVEGLPLLAVYRIGDDFFVTDCICTHGNAMLTDGFQDGEVIECPFHGGAFDIKTGKATQFPCQAPLKTYEVIVQDDTIFIRRPL
jgi:ethylbenzene dioxygenase ferredoxin subunit